MGRSTRTLSNLRVDTSWESTTGTLYLLQVVLSRMFAERGLFPTYGNPDDLKRMSCHR